MFIEKLTLVNYRNYKTLDLIFTNNINIFIGENAQGKTNIIESIYYLSFVNSHRTNYDRELIMFNQEFTKLNSLVRFSNYRRNYEVIVTNKGKKVKINNRVISKLSEYVANINAVLFAPEDLELVKGSPAVRRRFLDMEIIQINPQYLYYLNEYNKILKQRNKFFKEIVNNNYDDIYFNILTEKLIDLAAVIYKVRIDFIKKLNNYIKDIHLQLSNDTEELVCIYKSFFDIKEDITLNQIKSILDIKFKKIKNDEISNRSTLVGPHKDDLDFLINNLIAKKYASQGQQRSIVLSLKLAEIKMIYDIKGEYPILLLDDVLSELDNNRKTNLLNVIDSNIQTFITTTNLEGIKQEVLDNADFFKVRDGKIQK